MALGRSKASIFIVAAGTHPSAVASSDQVVGEIKSYNESGGADDIETVPVFGGDVSLEKPREQYEIELEIIPKTLGTNWQGLIYGEDQSNAGIFTTATEAGNKMIVVEYVDGTDYESVAYNNCNAVELSQEHSADDNLMYTLRFKFSPLADDGSPNRQWGRVAKSSLVAWSSLTDA